MKTVRSRTERLFLFLVFLRNGTYFGGYNLVVKVLDCDSENTGSSPVTHPPIHNFCKSLSR